jgi:hypothetical protein
LRGQKRGGFEDRLQDAVQPRRLGGVRLSVKAIGGGVNGSSGVGARSRSRVRLGRIELAVLPPRLPPREQNTNKFTEKR